MSSFRRLSLTFLLLASLTCTGWSKGDAFLLGCLTSLLFLNAVEHSRTHYRTTVVIQERGEVIPFRCRVCQRVYYIPEGAVEHTCPSCGTVYRLR